MSIGKLSPFNPTSDDFDAWTGVLDNYLIANGVDKSVSSQEAKANAILLSSIGLSTYALLSDILSPDKPEDKKFADLITTLRTHFTPAPKAIAERFKFTSLMSVALAQETAIASTQVVRSGNPSAHSVPEGDATFQVGKKDKYKPQPSQPRKKKDQGKCPNCGSSHPRSECPHRDVECFVCRKRGHFAKFCKSKKSSSHPVHTVNSIRSSHPPIMLHTIVHGREHEMELDTASSSSFVNKKFWYSLGKPKFHPSQTTFKTFTGQEFKSVGRLSTDLQYNGQSKRVILEISDDNQSTPKSKSPEFKSTESSPTSPVKERVVVPIPIEIPEEEPIVDLNESLASSRPQRQRRKPKVFDL
ncbi:Gag polyprotein [Folsomia candida]|uniref:Gag polyprotein n=1 Tax=Folsomia candida TaxID=158441 RepID=A0A226CZU5_FOLCA|nr:Gag polyprotein [Folsomia candida]